MSIAVLMAGLAAAGAGVLPAQEIFWDGFEYGDLCGWSNPPALYQEQEAFDEGGANDFAADAEVIPTRCAIVQGTIGDPWNAGTPQNPDIFPDTDFFELTLEGPALLNIRLERIGGASTFLAAAEITNTYDNYPFFGLTGCDLDDGYPSVTTRQIYLPENGFVYADPEEVGDKMIPNNNVWIINVDDGRNYDPCQLGLPPELIGDVNQTYRMTLTIDPVAGPALPFPYVEQLVQIPGDGSALIYRVDGATVSALDLIETFSDRVPATEGILDTKLYVVRKAGSTLDTIAGDDDFEPNLLHFDSRLQEVTLTADPHFVIVDHYGKYESGPIDLELTIQYLQTVWP